MLLHNMVLNNYYLYIYKNLCKHKRFVNIVDNFNIKQINVKYSNYGSR